MAPMLPAWPVLGRSVVVAIADVLGELVVGEMEKVVSGGDAPA